MPKDEKEKSGEESKPVAVNSLDDPKAKKVKVRFLIDYVVSERTFLCGQEAEIPEGIAKGFCDGRSVEYVK